MTEILSDYKTDVLHVNIKLSELWKVYKTNGTVLNLSNIQ